MSFQIDKSQVNQVMLDRPPEMTFPISLYDIKLSSADGKTKDLLSQQKGKVTLLFNVAAGCGNIPQHGVLEQLNQLYKDQPDFSIIAVTVDDFRCHGYPEFQNGIDAYINDNQLDMTPGEVAQEYAMRHFGATYEFTELTNGRHDKHTYDPNYAPGSVKTQEQHTLWSYLTGAFEADLQESGVPYHQEEVPWSNAKPRTENGKKYFSPLTGNFTKFLIDRTGTRARRFSNGFLLGERTIGGDTFPWYPEKYQQDGRKDHNPVTKSRQDVPPEMSGSFPSPLQQFGIDVSLQIMSEHIDEYLRSV